MRAALLRGYDGDDDGGGGLTLTASFLRKPRSRRKRGVLAAGGREGGLLAGDGLPSLPPFLEQTSHGRFCNADQFGLPPLLARAVCPSLRRKQTERSGTSARHEARCCRRIEVAASLPPSVRAAMGSWSVARRGREGGLRRESYRRSLVPRARATFLLSSMRTLPLRGMPGQTRRYDPCHAAEAAHLLQCSFVMSFMSAG